MNQKAGPACLLPARLGIISEVHPRIQTSTLPTLKMDQQQASAVLSDLFFYVINETIVHM